MKQKIIARLKAKYSGVNLSNARLDAIAAKLESKITDENDIDARLDELNEIFPFADIAKQDDRLRTLESKSKDPKKVDPTPDPVDPPAPPADVPDWAKGLIDSNKALAQQLETLQAQGKQQSDTARLMTLLKEKKVDQAFLDDPIRKMAIAGKTFKDEAELEAFATTLVDAYTAYAQTVSNENLKNQPQPVMGNVKDPKTEVSPMMQQYLKDTKPDEKKTA